MTRTFALPDQATIDGKPIVAVSYLDPIADWDSGLACWSSEPNHVRDCKPVHLGCFNEDHPEAGEGMDIARQHGEATRAGSEWTVGKGTS